jgi:hypothetical protein
MFCALAGTAFGFAASTLKARAECVTPGWRLILAEVTSSDPSATHRTLWPEIARLSASKVFASIMDLGDDKVEGTIFGVSARR